MSYRTFVAMLVSAPFLFLLTSVAPAQDVDAQAEDVGVNREGIHADASRDRDLRRREQTSTQTNPEIASWLLIEQQNLIEFAQYGLQRTRTPEVVELAETVVRDHQRLVQQLAAVDNARTRPVRTRSEQRVNRNRDISEERREESREGIREDRRERNSIEGSLENIGERIEEGAERVVDRTRQTLRNTRDAVRQELNDDDRPMRGSLSWKLVHRDVSNEVTKLAKEELSTTHGEQFDASFVGMLSALHLQQEASLQVMVGEASGELAETLGIALRTVRQHRGKANQVMKTLSR